MKYTSLTFNINTKYKLNKKYTLKRMYQAILVNYNNTVMTKRYWRINSYYVRRTMPP